MKKREMLMFLVVMSFVMVLAGCKKTEVNTHETGIDESNKAKSDITEKGVQITDGYYYENTTGLTSFYRFNEDGTYYAKFFDGGVVDAGVYQVKDEEFEYSIGPGTDEDYKVKEDNPKATANKVIELTSYLGGDPLKFAFVNDEILDVNLAGMAAGKTLQHKADYAYNPSVDETPIIIQEFYANNSVGSMLTLNHNNTFGDTTGDTYLSGTWEIESKGNYLMRYDDFDTNGTLVVSEKGDTAVLNMPDGATVELAKETTVAADDPKAIVMTLVAKDVQVGLPMGVGLRVDGHADGTCELVVEIAAVGAELVADTGTFTKSESYSFTFDFDKAGEVIGTPDYTTATETGLDLSLSYKADTTISFNGSDTPLSIDSELTGTYSMVQAAAPSVIGTLTAEGADVGLPMGVDLRLDVYDDATCKLFVIIAAVNAELMADQGSYSVSPAYVYEFVFEKAGKLTGTPDYATATETGLDISLPYKAETTVAFNGADTPLAIDSTMIGTINAVK